MKPKIINILQHPPAYEMYSNSPRPEISWDTPNGQWVGIWGYDWPNQLGNEVLELTDDFEYEVWQPDLRADRIYSHQFNNGSKHRLFPASIEKKRWGFKSVRRIGSKLLMEYLRKVDQKGVILHLNNPMHHLNLTIMQNLPHIKKILEYHNPLSTPFLSLKKIRLNAITYWDYYLNHLSWLKNHQIAFVYNNSAKVNELTKYNAIDTERIFMGCDFNFWFPEQKHQAESSIAKESKLILMASLLHERKQIDKVIEIISEPLFHKYDFKLVVAGSGKNEYEEYLQKLSHPLLEDDKVEFVGYQSGQYLLDLYNKSDLFISAAKFEGGPVSVMKALACETPVMCTRVGGVDDIMHDHDAGILVEPFDYEQWKEKLIEFFEGKPVKLLDHAIAKEHFHWPNIANKFLEIYRVLKNA